MASEQESRRGVAAWQPVTEQLMALIHNLVAGNDGPADLNRFASHYAELARAYLEAVHSEGKTSMRAEAVVKALNLQTTKTALQNFLGKTPSSG